MTAEHLIKVNLPGGYVSAGDLYELLVIAENSGAEQIRFGNRQQLFFSVMPDKMYDLETDMLSAGVDYEIDADEYPNMISSYVCDTIFSHESWLREGVYRDIFDTFTYQPRLKINLIDRHQTFVPFFSGNLNFISADVSNYWYLYVRFPKTSQFYCWPSLLYSEDIAVFSKKTEEVILKNKSLFYDKLNVDEQLFYSMINKSADLPVQPADQALQLPDFYLPYYEGFNKYNNKYWLGIYRRNELFDISFLKEVCNLCIKTRIGQIYTTPWKSILIKGIEVSDRAAWGYILDYHQLNIRHAANELNWQIEDMCVEGLELKKQLVREFEDADLRTYRLSFAIKMRPQTGLTGSIIIKAQSADTFEILHTRNFNANSKDYISHQQQVKKKQLATQLMALCSSYYKLADNTGLLNNLAQQLPVDTQEAAETVYQCTNCLSIYDESLGDVLNSIAPGTPFESLSQYTCPVCDSGKEDFEPVCKKGWL